MQFGDAALRRAPATPPAWKHVILCEVPPESGLFDVRLAVTFGVIGQGLKRLSRLGNNQTTARISLKEALLAGAILEQWLAENNRKKTP